MVDVALHTAEEMAEDVALHLAAETVVEPAHLPNSPTMSVLDIPKLLPSAPTPRVAKCR